MPHLLSPAQDQAATLTDRARAYRSLVRRAINADSRYRLVAAHVTVAQAQALAAQADRDEQRARALLAQETAKAADRNLEPSASALAPGAAHTPAGQVAAVEQGEPPFDVVGDHVVVSTAGVPFLAGTVTASGPWGVEIEPSPGAAPQVLAWRSRGRTFRFQRQP